MIKPLSNRVLLEHPQEVLEVGGIHLPKAQLQDQPVLKVVAAGPKCSILSVGDHVYLPHISHASKVEHGGEKWLMIEEDKIAAIVE